MAIWGMNFVNHIILLNQILNKIRSTFSFQIVFYYMNSSFLSSHITIIKIQSPNSHLLIHGGLPSSVSISMTLNP